MELHSTVVGFDGEVINLELWAHGLLKMNVF